jgi:hypothetical protein
LMYWEQTTSRTHLWKNCRRPSVDVPLGRRSIRRAM